MQKCLDDFKPYTALEQIEELEIRIREANKMNDLIESKILFLRARCLNEIKNTSEHLELFIKAYKLDPNDENLKKIALISYFKLDNPKKALELADEVISKSEFDFNSWAVKTILSDDINFFLNKKVPNNVKENQLFKNILIFNILSNNKKLSIDKIEKDYNLKFIPSLNPKFLNHKNKFEWNINISILLNKILQKNRLIYIIGNNFIYDIENPNISHLLKFLKIYIEKLDNTELKKNINIEKFYYNYFKYIISPDTYYLAEIKKPYKILWESNSIFTIFYCQILNHLKKYKKSLKEINRSLSQSEDNKDILLHFKISVLTKLSKSKKTFKSLVKYIKLYPIIDQERFYNISHIIFSTVINDLKPKQSKELHKYLINLNTEDKNLTKLISQFSKTYILKEKYEGINDELKSISISQNWKNEGIRMLISTMLFDRNLFLENKKYLNSFIDKDKIGQELRIYILNSYQILLNENYEDQKISGELIKLLSFWREKNDALDIEIYHIEYELAAKLYDWKKVLLICEKYYKQFSNNESVLKAYLNALDKNEEYQTIKKIAEKLKINFQYEEDGLVIADIFIRNNIQKDKAFEIVFNLASNKKNKKARFIFLTNNFFQKDHREDPQVSKVGHFLTLKNLDDDKVFKKEIFAEDTDYINKYVGDIIIKEANVTKNLVRLEVTSIYDKYKKLHFEILEETQNPDNSYGIRHFQMNPDKPLDSLMKILGPLGDGDKNIRENNLENYFNYKIGFTEIARANFDENYIVAYNELTANHRFITIPSILTSKKFNKSKKFILDFTSLILFFQLSAKREIKFNTKFIISSLIKENINSIKYDLYNNPLSNINESYIQFLNDLIAWIDENCDEVKVEEKLDLILKVENISNEPFFQLLIDNMVLLTKENHIMISDELFFYQQSGRKEYTIDPKKYLLEIENMDKEVLLEHLLSKNYIGLDLSHKLLYREFIKFLGQQNNHYKILFENLSFLVNPNIEKLKEISLFLKDVYLLNALKIEDKNRHSYDVIQQTIQFSDKKTRQIFLNYIKKDFHLLPKYQNEIIKAF